MKTLLFAALLLGCCTLASAQAVRVDPPSVFTTAGTVAGSVSPLIAQRGAVVSVCNYPANGLPCTNLATTYQSNSTASACPAYAQVTLAGTNTCVSTTDSAGRFGFWVVPGNYAYTYSLNGKAYGPYPVSAGGGGGSSGTAVVLNGNDFGMNCASTTFDNATAITAMFTAQALVATATNGQGRVVFPPGVCYIGTTVNIPNSNIDVSGAGLGATTIEALPNRGLQQMLLFTGSNIKVHDLSLNGNISNYGISMGIAAWGAGTAYNTAASNLAASNGGGPDTVGILTSGNLAVYQCILAHTASSGNAPPNSTYWSLMTTISATGQVPGGGGALLEFNGPHVEVAHIEMTASQFGIYLVSTAKSVSDVNIHDSYCHDFGVQYSGNNSTMDCIHAYGTQASTGFYTTNLKIVGNTFQNIYVPITGPGYTASGFVAADDVVFSHNVILNVLNRTGGADLVPSGASGIMAQNWTKSNNVMIRNAAQLNNDGTVGVELEAQNFAITGNQITGFEACIGLVNEGDDTKGGVVAGNQCKGQGGTNGLYSGVQINNAGGGHAVKNLAVTGNEFSNYYDGVWINGSGGASNITLGPNTFDTISHTDIDDASNYSIHGTVMGTGTTVPTVCDIGSIFYATSGTTNWYGCSATNTWTALGSGGGGGGSGTVANGTGGYLAYYPSTGTVVSGLTPALGSTQSCGSSTTSCVVNFSANGLATGVSSATISGGGGGSSRPTDFQTTVSGQVLTANAACATATPCNAPVGGTTYSFTTSSTATLSGSTSGVIYEYIDTAGNLTFGSLATISCSNCTYVSGITAFPADSIHLYTWQTAAGSFTGTSADLRSFISGSQPLVAGTNVTITSSGGIKTISATGGGGGGTTVTMLPPYIELSSTLYDGTYAVTVPNFTGWTYSFGTTANTTNANGDVTLANASTSVNAFFGQTASHASIEVDMSVIGSTEYTTGGIWMYDSTNSFYWSLEVFNAGVFSNSSYYMSLNKYNSSGSSVSSDVNGIPINGRVILKMAVVSTTLTWYVSLNDGASFLPIYTQTVGTISKAGLLIGAGASSGSSYMDARSIILH